MRGVWPVLGSTGLVSSPWKFSRRRKPRSSSCCHRSTVSGDGSPAPAPANRSTTSANRSCPMMGGLLYIWNIEASFMASPMSPLTFSLPDMKSIWPDCLPESMSSQSCDAIWSVRLGLVAAPGFTTQAPSLMTAFHVPPPSPLTSYWITAFVPLDLSARKRPAIASNVSFPVGIVFSLSKRKQIHSARHRQHGAGDVSGALGAQECDRVRHVLGLPLALHRDPLDHPLVQRAQLGVGRDDTRRDRVARDVVPGTLEGDRLRKADQADLARRVCRLTEPSHEAGDRGHANDPTPLAFAHPREHRLRDLVGSRQVHGEIQLPVLVLQVLELADRVDEPGVVHADVDGTEVALDAPHHVPDLRRIANIARVAAGAAAGRLDLARRAGSAITVQVHDRDRAALGRQRRGIGFAEATRPPGDERDAAPDAQVHASISP